MPHGGAAVKIAILDDPAIGPVIQRLVMLGQAHGMLTVQIDAGQTRINLMHQLFFALAGQFRGTMCCNATWRGYLPATPIPGRVPDWQ